MLSREPSEASPRLRALPWSKPLRFGAHVALRYALSWVRVAQEFGERGRCDLSPFLPLLLSFLGGPLAPLVRQMVTVQHPRSLSKGACLQLGR